MADFLMKSTFFIVSIFLCCVKTSPAVLCSRRHILTKMAGNSLKPGDMLNSTTQLCSAANTFCLQFHNFGDNDTFSHLALYNQVNDQTWPPWIGNRNEPVLNNSGELILDHSGELKIASQGKLIKVLYNPVEPINSTEAILLDNGNFVLQQLHPNGSKTVLWQSFDYPTDVLFPGMKLGVNHKIGSNWSLISWRARHDPSSGDFRLEWEPIKRELIIRGRGVILWRSGLLKNNGSFENIPDELSQRFTIVSNEDEEYIKLTSSKLDEKISFWGLTFGGLLYDAKLEKYIVSADKCYGFNNDGGCQLYDVPRCWQHAEVGYGKINFTDIQNVKNDTNPSLTRLDCQQRCWNDCDCVGYSTNYSNTIGCTFLYKLATVITLHDPSDDVQLIYLLNGPLDPKGKSDNNSTITHPKSVDPAQVAKKGKRKWIWIGVMMATSLFTIYLFIIYVARKRKNQLKEKKRENPQTIIFDLLALNESTSANELQDNINKGKELKVFSCASIMEATNGFSSENKLGEGGFGPVYKGILPTRKEVAIKRLSKTSGQGIVEFKNELTLICELQHMNLVQLVGCCIHEEERMLIYEFMPNKSLDFFLFDSTRSKLLDWQKRLNIIEGIAQGLLYLHKYSRVKIIHRDLKASNILLDENMNPKISDFGMARIFTQQESKANTHRIVGTYGYMSPEYAMHGIFSMKSDVYSFGVLLLEIVSGKRNNSFYNDDGPLSLITHAWELWKEGAALQLMDQTLVDSYVYDEVLRCIHIGILCVEEDADDRPTMSNIISMLINKSATISLPKRPAFYTRKKISDAKASSKESNTYSINEVTVSQFDAR